MGFQGNDNFRTEQHHATADKCCTNDRPVVSTIQLSNTTFFPVYVFKYVGTLMLEKLILHCIQDTDTGLLSKVSSLMA